MAIDPTQSTTSSQAAATPPANPTSNLGKDQFMKLLVAELKAQDPLAPTDSKEMVAQIAQLSSVEKLDSIDSSMTALRSQNTGMASTQASGLIGRSVEASTDHVSLAATGAAPGQYQLLGTAKSVAVQVRDVKGNVVRTIGIGQQSVGTHTFQWDGLDDTGARAAAGIYQFSVAGKDAKGNGVMSSTKVKGLVSSIDYSSGGPELVVGDARIAFGDVVSIGL